MKALFQKFPCLYYPALGDTVWKSFLQSFLNCYPRAFSPFAGLWGIAFKRIFLHELKKNEKTGVHAIQSISQFGKKNNKLRGWILCFHEQKLSAEFISHSVTSLFFVVYISICIVLVIGRNLAPLTHALPGTFWTFDSVWNWIFKNRNVFVKCCGSASETRSLRLKTLFWMLL